MDNNETNFQLNNPAPAPIPQPLPEFRVNRRNGGFNGAQNRFCSDVTPAPIENSTPSFALGKREENQDAPSYTEKIIERKMQERPVAKAYPPVGTATDTPATAEKKQELNIPEKPFVTAPNSAVAPNVAPNPDFTPNVAPNTYAPPAPAVQTVQGETMGKYKAPQTQKKSNTGVAVLISVIATVMVLTGIFFVYQLSTGNNSKGDLLDSLFQSPTEAQTEDTPDYKDFFTQPQDSDTDNSTTDNDNSTKKNHTTQDYTNKNWKGIVIKDQPASNKKLTVQDNYELISKSTVSILCFTDEIKDDEDSAVSQGTGTIISSDGYIVTNSHVIGDSKSVYLYQVVDDNGKKYTAAVVGYDSRTDIAVLKINAKNLEYATFGKTDKLKVGDDVISVGDSGGIGFQDSLTKGIVSGKDRTLSKTNINYIQIDAAVNPGNSGGPICNMYGQVIGITTIKINSVSYEGMGFAIPSETIKEIADDLIKQGYVSGRVQIGITGTVIDATSADMYKVPQGIAIYEILETGSLANTDIKSGDIITEIDGTRVTSFDEVYAVLEKHKAGDKVKLKFYRVEEKDSSKGEYFTVTITLVADKGENQN